MSIPAIGHGEPAHAGAADVSALSRGLGARGVPVRIAHAVHASGGSAADLVDVRGWLQALNAQLRTDTDIVALDRLSGWHHDPGAGTIAHHSGKFFTVEGLRVGLPGNVVPEWDQPIINQPEVGLLGIIVRESGGVLHCLMQAKAEPGNRNGVQLSPTVQATRSNYTGVHGGKPVPYLDHFADSTRHRVVADVLQSEQGAWFLHKRNRNMVIEVREEVPLEAGFRWIPVGLLHRLLAVEDLVNMDTRTVLSCLPFSTSGLPGEFESSGSGFATALLRSGDEDWGCLHSTRDVLSWLTDVRAGSQISRERVPLADLSEWRRTERAIVHRTGRFFEVIGVNVRATGREVAQWSQPMFAAVGTGLVAFLVRRVYGVLHILVQLRSEPGLAGVAELAPTVQCTPDTYPHVPSLLRPHFLDDVLDAPSENIRFDTVLSDEGGRFYHTRSRHLIVETDQAHEHPNYRWMTCHQLSSLLQHSDYVNVQARSLVACLRSLAVPGGPRG
ncbi:NDP-hexose 2,3-dehydratase family protein [Prauserella cavernicola]|uniref:NDP-hexose 2,3-dehydratase family protein n=1 Tax=Prauserella cavernicola TaxID=2800127 RepID=A0A934QYR3_9PSEU|nr:NDP-hexose 2,3-dehydratase family protein [Prauserella cavernicola]MBK1787984.1 NDP-hexose 2,3-dehydratase family protein [Prauserella cavernicola]